MGSAGTSRLGEAGLSTEEHEVEVEVDLVRLALVLTRSARMRQRLKLRAESGKASGERETRSVINEVHNAARRGDCVSARRIKSVSSKVCVNARCNGALPLRCVAA